MTDETIEWRGEVIDVGKTREWLSRCKKEDGTPYFTPEQIEERVQKQILSDKRMIGRLVGARYEKHEGYRLAFYQKEHKLFPEAYSIKVDNNQASLIVRKLLRHFGNSAKAKSWRIRFYGNSQSGSCGWSIRLSHNPSIGLICHEVSHTFHLKHDKKLMQYMKRMITYCKKHSYWITIEPPQ